MRGSPRCGATSLDQWEAILIRRRVEVKGGKDCARGLSLIRPTATDGLSSRAARSFELNFHHCPSKSTSCNGVIKWQRFCVRSSCSRYFSRSQPGFSSLLLVLAMLRYALGRPAFRAKLRRPSTLPPHLRSTSRLWVHLKLPGTRGHFGTPRLRLTNFDQEINAVGKKAQRYGVRDWDWRLPTKNRIGNDCCASRGEISSRMLSSSLRVWDL
jgi:hypothetical protein